MLKLNRKIYQKPYVNFKLSGIREHKVNYDGQVESDHEACTETGLTEIEYINKYALNLINNNYINDWKIVQKLIEDAAINKGWVNLNDNEKLFFILFYCSGVSDNDKIAYLTNKGKSQMEAMQFLVDAWEIYQNKYSIPSARKRWRYAKRCILLRVTRDDVEDFCHQVETLRMDLLTEGILGKDYGSSGIGIMNFMESTYDYVGCGFAEQNFTFNFGNAADCIAEVKDILVSGKYIINEELTL